MNRAREYFPKLFARNLSLALLLLAFLSASVAPDASADSGSITLLNSQFLLGSDLLPAPVDMRNFAPSSAASPPLAAFEGLLSLDVSKGLNRAEALVDSFSIVEDPRWKLTGFPPFSFEFVSDGTEIIPVLQAPQRTTHPYWEILLGPGTTWSEPGDLGWSRAALPFALKERNQNCIHNGIMTFAFKPDGSVSRVAWQISSETCLYLKANLWGVIPASYRPMAVAGAKETVAAHRKAVAARMPVKPIGEITADYPQVKLSAMTPPEVEDSSVYGFVVDGTHYRGGCQTRHGPYPFCDVLSLPSYSLAKSIFAGLNFLQITREWPEFSTTPVSELVPECRLPDRRWDDVTMYNLINMTTGNYDLLEFGKDEDAAKMQKFFVAESHAEKIAFSCEAWPRKSEPGANVVYHTTDVYILGAAMNAFVRRKTNPEADIYRDFLYPKLFEPLNLSPLMRWTQRTYDETAQPFTAYGLVMHADDLVRIAAWLISSTGDQLLFNQPGFDRAMFRDRKELMRWNGRSGEAYRNGFWGIDASGWLDCAQETWIAFMSGYGGIVVALMPNDTVYYNFSDSNLHRFRKAAAESNKIRNYCVE